MKRFLIPAVASLTLLCPLPAQEAGVEPPVLEKAATQGGDAQVLVKDLGSTSYKTRLEAERKLRELGKNALPALKAAAERKDDPEVQWRARRLVNQIERGDGGGFGARPDERGRLRARAAGPLDPADPAQPGDDMQRRFDSIFEQLERDFGVDIPRGRFFQDDFFRDLHEQMQDLRQGMALPGQGRAMLLQIGPDGVRAEVKVRNDKGEEENKVYEAPDLEAFQQKYPGVLENQGLGGGVRLWGAPQFRVPDLRGLQPFRRLDPIEPTAPMMPDAAVDLPPPGKRLGVAVRPEIPADVRDYLGLAAGQGLMVQEVQDGTLAATMGIQRLDVVLELGGKAIGSTADVQAALGGIAVGDKVEVKVLRRGQELLLSADKPAVTEAPAAAGEKGLKPRQKEPVIR